MRLSFLIVLIAFIFSSCAFHSGVMTGSASITDANFKYVALAKGTSTTTQVFGIGGLKKKALVFEAKKDLLFNYPLRNGQALANVTVDLKKTFVFIVVKTRVTVTADIVDFNAEETKPGFDSVILANYQNGIGLGLLDSVYIVKKEHIKKGQIVGFNDESVSVKYLGDFSASYHTYSSMEYTLLKTPSQKAVNHIGFNVNEKVIFLDKEGRSIEGVTFGINKLNVGVKYDFKSNGDFSWVIIPIGRVLKLD